MSIESIVDLAGVTVGYTTDVEGNLTFWNKYIECSKVLSRVNSFLVLKDNCHFVYGGDSCDRGNGDLQVLSDLVSLKERYPSRVHLLMGNRDINKLRFPTAMLPEVLSLKPGCYFAAPIANISADPDFKFNDRVCKMKWILTHTMGSPFAFEYRRQELHRSNLPASDADVADSFCDVVDLRTGLMLKYLERAQVAVILGDVMFLHGAVHDFNRGFIPYTKRNSSTGSTSSATPPSCTDLPTHHTLVAGYIVDDPFEWCEQINAFAASEIRDFKENITAYLTDLSAEIVRRKEAVNSALSDEDRARYTDRDLARLYTQVNNPTGIAGIGATLLHDETSGYYHPQPGSGLIQYGMGVLADGGSTRSAIYSSYLHQGRPSPCSGDVAQWLLTPRTNSCGSTVRHRSVRKVVVGHQPHADAPLVLHVGDLQIISADSSYSVNTQWPLSQLDAIFLPASTNYNPSTATAGAGAQKHSVPAASPDEEWLSYADYLKRTPGALAISSSGNNANSNGVIPASADTRSEHCIAELLFCFGSADIYTGAVSKAVVHGQLSQGSTYASALDSYVGRETSDGWYVKAAGVRLPRVQQYHTDTTSSTAIAEASEWYYLLAHSAAYNFRNKLVASSDIAAHF